MKKIYAVIDTNVLVSALLLSHDGAFLVTGNCKHFPKKPIVVTPAEMLRIMEETFLCN